MVFPAYAGVNLPAPPRRSRSRDLPRESGVELINCEKVNRALKIFLANMMVNTGRISRRLRILCEANTVVNMLKYVVTLRQSHFPRESGGEPI